MLYNLKLSQRLRFSNQTTYWRLITITHSLKTNKLFYSDLICYMNINFRCRPAVLPVSFCFLYALSFPLLTVITALTLCPVRATTLNKILSG